jgi:photosystem II stability/assembly factor-like uncharacterized protein
MKRLPVLLALFIASALTTFAADNVQQPTLTPQTSNTTQLLISVSPVNENIVWASGTGGTYVRTTDGGNTWTAAVVPGAENLQFRDVYAVSANEAYLLSIGNHTGSFRIYHTTNAGATWKIEFKNELSGAFYDCFAFWSPTNGIAHSDSVNGEFPDLLTTNGETWESIAKNMPTPLPGEASFAASGTCVATQGETNAWITTGGSTIARVLATTDGGSTWSAYDTPLYSNADSGGFSIAFRDSIHGVLGGGDLGPDHPNHARMVKSGDGGQTWRFTARPPVQGAIFCLAYASGLHHNGGKAPIFQGFEQTVVITANTAPDFDTGAGAWTPDEGNTWYSLPTVSGYWAVAFANPQAGWFVGNNGTILKISF